MEDYLTNQEIEDILGHTQEQPIGFSSWKMRKYYWWKITSELTEAEYQGRKVTLDKPFRTNDGKSKFAVYVKSDSGNVVKKRFGDPNMEIKRDDPERRKSFRARHNCDTAKDKMTPRYWSCRQWRANAPVQDSLAINTKEKSIMEKENLDEAISRQERLKRSLRMKRRSSFLQRRAEIASRRMPSQQKLMARARRLAERMLKIRLARKSPEEMSPAEKSRVEDRVRKMGPIVERMARKLMPKLKQHAAQRMRSATAGEARQQAESVETQNISFLESLSKLSETEMKEKLQEKMSEAFKKKSDEMKEADPCWKGYEMIGMKDKDGKKVPNCVPKEELEEAVSSYRDLYKRGMGPKPIKNKKFHFDVEYTHGETGEREKKRFSITHTSHSPSYVEAGRNLAASLKEKNHKIHSMTVVQGNKENE